MEESWQSLACCQTQMNEKVFRIVCQPNLVQRRKQRMGLCPLSECLKPTATPGTHDTESRFQHVQELIKIHRKKGNRTNTEKIGNSDEQSIRQELLCQKRSN